MGFIFSWLTAKLGKVGLWIVVGLFVAGVIGTLCLLYIAKVKDEARREVENKAMERVLDLVDKARHADDHVASDRAYRKHLRDKYYRD